MNNPTKKAFSLIEVLLAATVIVIVLYTLVSVGRNSLQRSSSMHESAQAMLLAQQGLEIVRQIRDTNWIDDAQQGWSDFRYSSVSPIGWSSSSDGSTVSFDSNINRFVLIPEVTGQEKISINNTDYIRTVKYTSLDTNSMPNGTNDTGTDGAIQPDKNAVKVIVIVGWDNGTAQSTSISEVLTNWRPNY